VECTVDGFNGFENYKKSIYDYMDDIGDINLCVNNSNFD
jgi:hypothetical protein